MVLQGVSAISLSTQVMSKVAGGYPILYIQRSMPEDVIFQYALFDSNMNRISDFYQIDMRGITDISTDISTTLRDKPASPGLYFLWIGEYEYGVTSPARTWTIPILFTTSLDPRPLFGEDEQYLQHFFIVDPGSGLMLGVSPEIFAYDMVNTDEYMVFAYFHKGNQGRVVRIYKGSIVSDTGYAEFGVFRVSIKFNSASDMAYYMLQRSLGVPPSVMANATSSIASGDYVTAIRVLRPFHIVTLPSTTINISYDLTNYVISYDVEVALGQIDWLKLLSATFIGCGVGMAVGIGLIVTGYLAPVGAWVIATTIGGCLVGAGVGIAVQTLSTGSSSAPPESPNSMINFTKDITDAVSLALNSVYAMYNDANRIITQWYREGKISSNDYNLAIQVLDKNKETVISRLGDISNRYNTLINQAYQSGYQSGYSKGFSDGKSAGYGEGYNKGYNEGYSKGKADMINWAVVSGVAGLVGGVLIGKGTVGGLLSRLRGLI